MSVPDDVREAMKAAMADYAIDTNKAMSEKMSEEDKADLRHRISHAFEYVEGWRSRAKSAAFMGNKKVEAFRLDSADFLEGLAAGAAKLWREHAALQREADALREALVNLTETLCDWEYHRIPRDDAAQIVEKRFGGHIGRAWLHSINTLSLQDRSSEDK